MNKNKMKVTYWKDMTRYYTLAPHAGELYLSRIDYTANDDAGLSYTNHVDFVLEDRNDYMAQGPCESMGSYGTYCPPPYQVPPILYYANNSVLIAKRLKTINVYGNDTLQRRYEFAYDHSPASYRSMLTSVMQYGSDAASALPPTRFFWESNDSANADRIGTWIASETDTGMAPINDMSNATTKVGRKWFTGDVNGDGRTDFIAVMRMEANGNIGYPHVGVYVALSNGDGTFNTSYVIQELEYAWDPESIWFAGDVNGDGRSDIMGAIKDDASGKTRLVTGTANQYGVYFSFADSLTDIPWQGKAYQLWFGGDINGDGKTDFMAAYRATTAGRTVLATAIGEPGGPYLVQSMEIAAMWTKKQGLDFQFVPAVGWFSGDYNGDGKSEFMGYTVDAALILRSAIPNNPASYKEKPTGQTYGSFTLFPGDVNGDGKTDFMGIHVYVTEDDKPLMVVLGILSNGDGMFAVHFSPDMALAGYSPEMLSYAPVIPVPADVNGDGKTDLVVISTGFNQFSTYVSEGNGQFDFFGHSHDTTPYGSRWFTGDVNGDGKSDIMGIITAGEAGSESIRLLSNISLTPLDLVTSTTSPIGGKTTFEYLPSSAWYEPPPMSATRKGARKRSLRADENEESLVPMPFILQTLASITKEDGREGSVLARFNYEHGRYNHAEREFRGFEKVTSYQMKNASEYESVTDSWFLQGFTTKGAMSYQRILSRDNHVKETYNGWSVGTQTNGVTYPRLDGTLTVIRDNYQSPYVFSVYNEYDPVYLNLVSEYKYTGYISFDTGAPPNGYDTVTRYEYYNDPRKNILSKPTKVTVSADNILSRKWMIYDGKGRLVSEETCRTNAPVGAGRDSDCAEQDGTRNPVASYQYSPEGNLWITTPPNGCAAEVTYDTTLAFPVTSRNCLGHASSKTYYPQYPGRVWTATPAHLNGTGYAVAYEYDAFGRPVRETRPDGGLTEYEYLDIGQVSAQRVRKHERIVNGAAAIDHYSSTYFDGLGRTYAVSSTGPDNKNIVTETGYDEVGRVSWKTKPVFCTAEACEEAPFTAFYYDGLSRVIATQFPDLTYTTTDYRGLTRVVTDPKGYATTSTYDVYQRLQTTTDAKGTVTAYSYDLLGNLLSVARPNPGGGNVIVTSMTYDSLSRKIGMIDPDTGFWAYSYDRSGNLVSQTDAKGQTITFEYDELNRLRKKNYPAPNAPSVLNYYDKYYDDGSCAAGCAMSFATGALTLTTDPTSNTQDRVLAFDIMQRPVRSVKTVGAESVTLEKAYDSMGRTATLTYFPDDTTGKKRAFVYAYDPAGNTIALTDTTNGKIQVQYDGFTALSQPGRAVFPKENGISIETGYTYEPLTGKLSRLRTAQTGSCRTTTWTCPQTGSTYSDGASCAQACMQNLACAAPPAVSLSGSLESTVGISQVSAQDNTITITTGEQSFAFTLANAAASGTATVSSSTPGIMRVVASGNTLTFNGCATWSGTACSLYNVAGTITLTNAVATGSTISNKRNSIKKVVASDNTLTFYGCQAGSGTCTTYVAMGMITFTTTSPPSCPDPMYTCGGAPAVCTVPVACTSATTSTCAFIQDISYTDGNGNTGYDPNGNITTMTDIVNNITHTYLYDELNRLKQAAGTGAYTQTFDYDILGNIIFKSDVGEYAYTYDNKPHAVRTAGGMGFTYDANGNMITRPGASITWNADNKPLTIGNTTFTYDGMGNRVMKTTGSNTTYYFGEAYEIRNNTRVMHLFVNGQRIVSIRGDGKSFTTHGNHLGSASVVTDQLGEMKQKVEYYPFGTYRENQDFDGSFPNTNYTFTDQEYDETGLYDYHARQYDPVVGRFISPDSVVQSPGDLQTFNRYSYVRNNPLIYTDPSGNELCLAAIIGIGMAIGALSAGIASDWDLKSMAIGAVVGGVSGGVFSGMEGILVGTLGSELAAVTAGAAAGAVGGGLNAAINGINIGQGMLSGAAYGAAGAVVMLGVGKIASWLSEPVGVEPMTPSGTNGSISLEWQGQIHQAGQSVVVDYVNVSGEATPAELAGRDALIEYASKELPPGSVAVNAHGRPGELFAGTAKHCVALDIKEVGRFLNSIKPNPLGDVYLYACHSANGKGFFTPSAAAKLARVMGPNTNVWGGVGYCWNGPIPYFREAYKVFSNGVVAYKPYGPIYPMIRFPVQW